MRTGEIGKRVRCHEWGQVRGYCLGGNIDPQIEGLRSEIKQIPGLSVYLEESGVPETDSGNHAYQLTSWALTERVFYKRLRPRSRGRVST